MEKEIKLQRSAEWFAERRGKFTGSQISNLMVRGQSKSEIFGKSALGYIAKVAMERVFDPSTLTEYDREQFDRINDTATTAVMQWGIDHEDEARSLISLCEPYDVIECGSIAHPSMPFFAASPDALLQDGDKTGVLEIKCPKLSTYGEYTLNITDAESLKKLKPEYYWQVVAEMAVTDSEFAVFTWYHPQLPYKKIVIQRDKVAEGILLERIELAEKLATEIVAKINQD